MLLTVEKAAVTPPAPLPTDLICCGCCLKDPMWPPDGVVAPGPAVPDLTLGSWKLDSDSGKRWPCEDNRKRRGLRPEKNVIEEAEE